MKPIPSWHDDARWNGLVDGSHCPFCSGAGPRNAVAQLSASAVTVDETVAVRGYCCVIARVHAIELHALPEETSLDLMRDVRKTARLVQEITGAVKLNYEIHGNVVPHVHMHIIPRYRGDAIERKGVGFARLTETPYAPGEFDAFAASLAQGLRDA